jgi:hypothetical protein
MTKHHPSLGDRVRDGGILPEVAEEDDNEAELGDHQEDNLVQELVVPQPLAGELEEEHDKLGHKSGHKVDESDEWHGVGQPEEVGPRVADGRPGAEHGRSPSRPHQEEGLEAEEPLDAEVGVAAHQKENGHQAGPDDGTLQGALPPGDNAY